MYRLTYDMGKVGNFISLKVSFVAKDNQFSPQALKKPPVFNKFNYQSSDYLNVSIRPYITLEISNPFVKMEEGRKEYDPNRRVNLNRYGLFWLIKALNKMKRNFVEIKDLYYYYDGKLMLNPDKAASITYSFISANKRIILKPSIIEDTETHTNNEGILFCINDTNNFAPLKYAEMEYLAYTLEKLDLESILSILIQSDSSNLVSK